MNMKYLTPNCHRGTPIVRIKMPVNKSNVSDDNLLDSQESQETEEEITKENVDMVESRDNSANEANCETQDA